MSGHHHANSRQQDLDGLAAELDDSPAPAAAQPAARRTRHHPGQQVEDEGSSGFAHAINAHLFTHPQTELQRRYRVTGPPPLIDASHLRAASMPQLRAMIHQLTSRYGTQNAQTLIDISRVMLSRRGPQRPQPLDQDLLGGFDVWQMDAALYREYMQLVPHPGHVTMGPGTMTVHPNPTPPPPPTNTPQQQQPPQGDGSHARDAAGEIDHIDVGGVPHYVHTAESWLHGLATLGELAGIAGVEHGVAGAVAMGGEFLGAALMAIGAFVAIWDASDYDNQLAQAEGFSYGLVYAITRRSGPTRGQYPPGVFTIPDETRLNRWARGIADGRGFVGPAHRDAVMRLALAIARDGGDAVLNAVFQRAIQALGQGAAASAIHLQFPGPGHD
jgi:hypothetical protein